MCDNSCSICGRLNRNEGVTAYPSTPAVVPIKAKDEDQTTEPVSSLPETPGYKVTHAAIEPGAGPTDPQSSVLTAAAAFGFWPGQTAGAAGRAINFTTAVLTGEQATNPIAQFGALIGIMGIPDTDRAAAIIRAIKAAYEIDVPTATTSLDTAPAPAPPPARGSIELVVGPMFAGKSTELVRRLRRYQAAGRHCLTLKYVKDTRYVTDKLATHDSLHWAAVPCSDLRDIAICDLYDVVGIDEGQFFPEIVQFCEDLANRGKVVVVAALDGTFQRLPFGHIAELICRAEDVTKLSAVCFYCKGSAAFSQRLGSETQVEIIGGADKYVAACRECHVKHSTK